MVLNVTVSATSLHFNNTRTMGLNLVPKEPSLCQYVFNISKKKKDFFVYSVLLMSPGIRHFMVQTSRLKTCLIRLGCTMQTSSFIWTLKSNPISYKGMPPWYMSRSLSGVTVILSLDPEASWPIDRIYCRLESNIMQFHRIVLKIDLIKTFHKFNLILGTLAS